MLPSPWHVPPHPRRAAAPSITLAEEPGLPPGHAGAPGADGEWPWAPGAAGARPRPPPQQSSPLPAPPRASACSSSASTSWSCCWTMLLCHGASRYPGRGRGTARGHVPHRPGNRCPPTPLSSPGRTRPWARSPSPSSGPLELPCRSSSSCILQGDTHVPRAVPQAVPRAVPQGCPTPFSLTPLAAT